MHKIGLSPCEQPRPRCAPSFSSVCPSFLFSRVCSGSAAVSMNAQYHTATMANTLLVKWLTSHQLFVEPQEADDKRELLFCTEPRSTVSTTRCLADNVRTASKKRSMYLLQAGEHLPCRCSCRSVPRVWLLCCSETTSLFGMQQRGQGANPA